MVVEASADLPMITQEVELRGEGEGEGAAVITVVEVEVVPCIIWMRPTS